MLQDTRIALFLLEQLIAALQANDPDTFKRWLYGGIQDMGEPSRDGATGGLVGRLHHQGGGRQGFNKHQRLSISSITADPYTNQVSRLFTKT